MPKFTIIETIRYEVEAANSDDALDAFLANPDAFNASITERDIEESIDFFDLELPKGDA